MSLPFARPNISSTVKEFAEELKRGYPKIEEVYRICQEALKILSEEPTLLKIDSDVIVIGDIHGQFFDFLEILKIDCGIYKYLFLGDYVDRGANSLETILLLLYMKIEQPESVWMLRGNHESRRLSFVYGFYEECVHAYGNSAAWEMICEVFEYLPLAAVIDGKTFAVHGGIGPSTSLASIISADRVNDILLGGIVSELLWSDPDEEAETYKENTRGAGFLFGKNQVEEFLEREGLIRIIRSHQLVDTGYKEHFNGKLVTIWSAPNYCYRCMNKAVIAKVSGEDIVYIEVPMAQNQQAKPRKSLYFI